MYYIKIKINNFNVYDNYLFFIYVVNLLDYHHMEKIKFKKMAIEILFI